MTELDLQQYKYRRNFPYNNTIKEESIEYLSENRSIRNFNSMHPKPLINKVLMNQVQSQKRTNKKYVFEKDFVKSSKITNDENMFFNMKSENVISKVKNENDDIIVVEDYGNEFGKQVSERVIKTSDRIIDEYSYVGSIFWIN